MATVAHELSCEAAWEDAFDDSAQAIAYASDLARQLEGLRGIARLAIQAALDRFPRGHKERFWAEISRADLMFLTEERAARVATVAVTRKLRPIEFCIRKYRLAKGGDDAG